MSTFLKKLFPFLSWLPELKNPLTWRADIIAGLTVAMVLIPQSMAYAHLAGLPVYMGLYAAFLPGIVAALFGSSRFLSTGPVPVSSLLTAVALQPLVAAGSLEYVHYVVLLTLLTGIIQLALGVLRFGVVANFLSSPVLLGFISAVAIIIASMQVANLFGVYAVPAPRYYQTVWQVLTDIVTSTHWPTVGIAVIAFIIILGGRRLRPNWPHTLIAVVVTTLIAWLSGFEQIETINTDQIVNLPVQQMLTSYQRYPQELQRLIDDVAKAKKIVSDQGNYGENTEKTDNAINNASQASWQLERLIHRHNFESAQLNRLRLRRMRTKDNQTVFFNENQMSPLGQVDPGVWRINVFSGLGQLTLRSGGEVIGHILPGLPSFQPVRFNWDIASQLFIAALVLALVGFTEAITIAKRIATETRQRLDINQELIGQGLAKCLGSFFQSMPVSGGFTRTAVNYHAGAKTPFSAIVASLIVMVALLWLTPLFYYLPYATLAVVIIVGVLGLLDFNEIRRVWQVSRHEGVVVLATFLLTLFLAPGLAQAVILGMLLSLGVYLYETMRPRFTELTRNDEGDLVEISINDKRVESCYLISLIRFNGSLYFANVSYFEEKILQLISAKQKLRYIILDCVSINKLDASGLETLISVCERLEEAGMELWFSRVRQPVFTLLKRGGLFDKLGEHHFYKNNEQALAKLAEHLGAKHMNNCPLAKKI